MIRLRLPRLVLGVLAASLAGSMRVEAARRGGAAESAETLDAAVAELVAAAPSELSHLTKSRLKAVGAAARLLNACAERTVLAESPSPSEQLATIHQLCDAKRRVDLSITEVLNMRTAIALAPQGQARRGQARQFLRISSALMDLSARLNYLLREAIVRAAFAFAGRPPIREQLVDQLAADRSTIGASLMAPLLLDPPEDSPNGAKPAGPATKLKVLQLLARQGRSESSPIVVQFLESGEATPELVVAAADTLCHLGLAQQPPPDGSSAGWPTAAITAGMLQSLLESVDDAQLAPAWNRRRAVLLDWLARRAQHGAGWSGYATGGVVIQPGDWVLMRNASPYNMFTDLSPGLFTHAGVAALKQDDDGAGRLVLVDLNERDSRIGATNLEEVLPSSLYFAVLRHDDPAVARKMGETAASMIGNPARFDLAFDTSRIAGLRGEPLAGRKIVTYCAGLLLLCAQATGRARDEFFPLIEYPASERLDENLHRIGLRLGADFVSPSGALFARHMRLVHLSEPMYDPGRDVEQGVYDYFAQRMASETLVPRPDLFQSLRQELADASKSNPLLSTALARAAGVDADTDLAAGAKALAVVETLDAIAADNSGEFAEALRALQVESAQEAASRGLSQSEMQRIEFLRHRHADLSERSGRKKLDPLQLSAALVEYYTERGKRHIDARFFPPVTGDENADAR